MQLTARLRCRPSPPGTFPRGCPHPYEMRLVERYSSHRRWACSRPGRTASRGPAGSRSRSPHPPVGDRHRRVREHLARHMHRARYLSISAPVAAAARARLPAPASASSRHANHAPASRADLGLRPPAATIHLRSAFLPGTLDHSAVRFSLQARALLRIPDPVTPST